VKDATPLRNSSPAGGIQRFLSYSSNDQNLWMALGLVT